MNRPILALLTSLALAAPAVAQAEGPAARVVAMVERMDGEAQREREHLERRVHAFEAVSHADPDLRAASRQRAQRLRDRVERLWQLELRLVRAAESIRAHAELAARLVERDATHEELTSVLDSLRASGGALRAGEYLLGRVEAVLGDRCPPLPDEFGRDRPPGRGATIEGQPDAGHNPKLPAPAPSTDSPMEPTTVLFVDDRAEVQLETMQASLPSLELVPAVDGDAAVKALGERSVDVVLLDLRMPRKWARPDEEEGFAILRELRERFPDLPIILYSESDELDLPVRMVQDGGAFWFLRKTSDPDEVEGMVHVAVARARSTRREVRDLREAVELARHGDRAWPGRRPFHGMVGVATVTRRMFDRVRRYGPTDLNTVILGDNGTGKGRVARALHKLSPRAEGPFVAVNCASLAKAVAEAELFGTARGAFTGAEHRAGFFEAADRGTLFLDEIGDLAPSVQPKLLRALEEGEVTRVGSTRAIPVDVRVICATNQPLREMVAKGRFRKDLYYRVNVCEIEVPPLRDRSDDIPALVEAFSRDAGIDPARWSGDALGALQAYDWPGNVRELINLVKRAGALCDGEIRAPDLELPGARRDVARVEPGVPEPDPEPAAPPAADRLGSVLLELAEDDDRRKSVADFGRRYGEDFCKRVIMAAVLEHRSGKRAAAALGFEFDNWRNWLRNHDLSVRTILREEAAS